jgi:hypothetical protein
MKTAVEWLKDLYENQDAYDEFIVDEQWEKAKEMEKEQIGYTKADVIKAGEMGEINYLDTLHITTYLDEAKKFNETYGGKK